MSRAVPDPPEMPDLVIVGSGPAGAIVAHEVRQSEPEATIVMVEAGPPLGDRPGTHLSDHADPALREVYARFISHIQHNYVEASDDSFPSVTRGPYTTPAAGVVPAARLGFEAVEMPGASVAWNSGGMGIHWTAACPLPGPDESVDGIPAAEWRDHVAVSSRLLRATRDGYRENPFGPAIVTALDSVVPCSDPARAAQNMPMAGQRDERGYFRRTGPADIFAPIGDGGDEHFTLLTDTVCRALEMDGSRACAVRLLDLTQVREWTLPARRVVVAADALRSPQLLFASGIRPRALGRYLNDHISVATETRVDPVRLGMSGAEPLSSPLDEPFVGSYWVPSRGAEQPFQAQPMEVCNTQEGHRLGIGVYVTTELRESNRVWFDERETDHLGMPRPRIAFSYTDRDLGELERAKPFLRRLVAAIGADERELTVMLAGGSLHYTGTVRMGVENDGTTVCDLTGRVWDTDNVYVAGNGVIPFAISCNCTLTAGALAVRTGRTLAAELCDPQLV